MKKIISLILSLTVMAVILPTAFAGYTDIPETEDYFESAVRLQDLGIITGYEDGSFKPDAAITRAEFTKIVVSMMDKETEAKASTNASSFYDVPAGSWSAPYINYAVSKDILSGYSDGSFGPDRTISLSEAVTILLRTLGYTEKEVGYFWPDNYMNAASALGITEGIGVSHNAPLTRALAGVLTDRTLFIKPGGDGVKTETYLETIGYSVLSDALILDEEKQSNSVNIISGNLKLGNAQSYANRIQTGVSEGEMYEYAVIDKDGYLCAVKDYDSGNTQGGEVAVVNKITGNTIEYTTVSGIKGSYRADDSFIIYYDNSKMTFASAKERIKNGDDITFYGATYGLWNIAVVGGGGDIDPVLASHSFSDSDNVIGNQTINKTNLTVYRDGKAAKLSDIKANDAVYYNTKTNTMDVYSKKVTGVYYEAYPSKAYVESIRVGGKSYNIGYSAATSKLDASAGAFEIGEKVTLILGKNDEVVFVTDNAGSVDYYGYGVVISSVTRTATSGENNGNTEFVTEMFMADGEIHEIVTSKLYNNNVGDFMHITYSNGLAELTRQNISNKSKYSGKIDKQERTIAGKYLLKDAVIIQRVSDEDSASAECEILDFENISATNIYENQIINVVTGNGFGDIAIMYVQSLENSYTYGVITGFEKSGNETTGYKIFAGESTSGYMLYNIGKINTYAGAGVGFKAQGNTLTKIISLVKFDSANSVDAVEGSRIMINGDIYKMADEVEIVDITSLTNIRSITIDELASMKNISSVDIYSDKSAANGGVVRVITVKTK